MNTQYYTTSNTTRRDEPRQRTENAVYTRIVRAVEAEQKRMAAARKATAAFLATLGLPDDGDQIFA